MTIVIMGITVVTVLGAIGTYVSLTDTHRKQARAGAYVRSYGEALQAAIATYPTGYVACATTYSVDASAWLTGYTAKVNGVKYWAPSTNTWNTACGTDSGVQKVALQVASDDNRAVEYLDVDHP